MGGYTSTGSNMKFWVLKAKTGDENIPFFGKKEKLPNGEWDITQRHNNFSGILVGMELGQYEWKQSANAKPRIIDTLTMYMKDPDGTTNKVEMAFSNGLVRSILNSLAEAGPELVGKQLNISVYKNDNGYASASLQLNGAKMNWRYAPDTFPKPKSVQVGNQEVIDSSESDEFFKKVLANEILPHLPPPPAKGSQAPTTEHQNEPVTADQGPTDDLPF